jgi:hypothetical protein
MDNTAFAGYQESLQTLEKVGEGALVEAYARAVMEISSTCRGSDLVNGIRDLFAWRLVARGRHDVARMLASESTLPNIEGAAQGYQAMQPANLGLYLQEFEIALDAIARMEGRPR